MTGGIGGSGGSGGNGVGWSYSTPTDYNKSTSPTVAPDGAPEALPAYTDEESAAQIQSDQANLGSSTAIAFASVANQTGGIGSQAVTITGLGALLAKVEQDANTEENYATVAGFAKMANALAVFGSALSTFNTNNANATMAKVQTTRNSGTGSSSSSTTGSGTTATPSDQANLKNTISKDKDYTKLTTATGKLNSDQGKLDAVNQQLNSPTLTPSQTTQLTDEQTSLKSDVAADQESVNKYSSALSTKYNVPQSDLQAAAEGSAGSAAVGQLALGANIEANMIALYANGMNMSTGDSKGSEKKDIADLKKDLDTLIADIESGMIAGGSGGNTAQTSNAGQNVTAGGGTTHLKGATQADTEDPSKNTATNKSESQKSEEVRNGGDKSQATSSQRLSDSDED